MNAWGQLLASGAVAALIGAVAAILVARSNRKAQVDAAVAQSRGDIEAGAFTRASEFSGRLFDQQAQTIARLDQRVIAQQRHIDEQDQELAGQARTIADQGRQLAAQEVQLGAQDRQIQAQDAELIRLRGQLQVAQQALQLRYPDE